MDDAGAGGNELESRPSGAGEGKTVDIGGIGMDDVVLGKRFKASMALIRR
jgi:hypothetical protein